MAGNTFGRLFTDHESNPAAEVSELIIVQDDGARKFYEPGIDVRFYAVRVPANPTDPASMPNE